MQVSVLGSSSLGAAQMQVDPETKRLLAQLEQVVGEAQVLQTGRQPTQELATRKYPELHPEQVVASEQLEQAAGQGVQAGGVV
jgi:hypothetical protein